MYVCACLCVFLYLCVFVCLFVCVCVCVCTAISRIDGHSSSRFDTSAVNHLTGHDVSICRGELEDFLLKVKLRPVYLMVTG